MRIKQFYLPALALLMLGGLISCTDQDEPQNVESGTVFNPNDKDNIEWSADIVLPDDFKTRAPASGTVGSDGLYTFSRQIDRLWYAVYYNGAYLYDSEQELAPDAIKKGDAFTVLFKFHKDLDPTKIYIFFWAGNQQDNVTVADVTKSDAITLNFKNRCVSVDPKYMNGNNSALQEYDSFAGYFQLSSTKDVSNYNMKVTLKRPFAQIHVLSDEFTFPGVTAAFPNGVTVVPGFGTLAATTSNYTTNLVSPTTWFYDSSISLNPTYKKNEFMYTLTDYEFTNKLSGRTPERVTFKNRLMDYLGCFYVFAPIEKSPLKYAASSGNTSSLQYLNLAFRKNGSNISSSEFAAVKLPTEGLKANNRYVIYNHANTGDGDGGGSPSDPDNPGGGGGFITDSYAFEVVTAPGWDGTEETVR